MTRDNTPKKRQKASSTTTPEQAEEHFRTQLQQLSAFWMNNGLPSTGELERIAGQLETDKKKYAIGSIWEGTRVKRPLMVTATLDDGLGQGLRLIHRYAEVIGLEVHHLGLMQAPEKIIAACRWLKPRFLGLTVLQLDSDEDLARIGFNLPRQTRLIAGGPVFQFDPEMADRCNVHFTAANVAYFIDFICKQR